MTERRNFGACMIEGCDLPAKTLGRCKRHYDRFLRHGKDMVGLADPPHVRLMANVQIVEGCWVWLSTRSWAGYGRWRIDGRSVMAHRFAYELFRGPIPAGLQLDHLCRNTSCVNPYHLEPVTAQENVLRSEGLCAINARKTHCVRGHEFTEANTRIAPSGSRMCRNCEADRSRVRRGVA